MNRPHWCFVIATNFENWNIVHAVTNGTASIAMIFLPFNASRKVFLTLLVVP